MKIVGIDVGGTFTDLILCDMRRGRIATHKVPTTPEDPLIGVMAGLGAICRMNGVDPASVGHVLHGTTTATNAVLENQGARIGMITNEGFRDIIHIGRHQRVHHYSIMQELPWQNRPLAARRHRKTVRGCLIPPSGERDRPDPEVEAISTARGHIAEKGVSVQAELLIPVRRQAGRVRDRILPARPVTRRQEAEGTSRPFADRQHNRRAARCDGMDAVDTLYANTRNNPVEDMESQLPPRIDCYELRNWVAPAGKWRGGVGSVRRFTYLADEGFSIEGEGHIYPPWGFDGGRQGTTGQLNLIGRDGTQEALMSKVPYHRMAAGESLVAYGPCGGGYGNPLERDPDTVLADVLDDFITPQAVDADYGVIIRDAKVDVAATIRCRSSGVAAG